MPNPTTLARSVTRAGDHQPLPRPLKGLGVQMGLARLSQQVGGQGGPIHHRGHPHGDDRHPQAGPVQGRPGVAHPGAWGDAGIGQLDGGTHPA